MLSAPKTEMDFIIKFLLKDIKYTQDASKRYWLSCSTERAKMPSLFIRFGGYFIEVKNTDYATPNPASSDNC